MLYEAVVWVDAYPSGVPTDPTPGGLVVDRQVWQRGPGREITWVGPFQGIHSHLVTNAPWSAHIWNLSLTRSGCTRRSCASGISERMMPIKNLILRVVTHKAAWCFSILQSYFVAKSRHCKNSCRTDISANFWGVREIAARRQFERKLVV